MKKLLVDKRFWAAVALAVTIILSALGVKNAQTIGTAIQAVIQALPDADQGSGETVPVPTPVPDYNELHATPSLHDEPATTPSSDGASTGPVEGQSETLNRIVDDLLSIAAAERERIDSMPQIDLGFDEWRDENYYFADIPQSIEIDAPGGAFVTVNGQTIAVPRGATITVEPIRPRPEEPPAIWLNPPDDENTGTPLGPLPSVGVPDFQHALRPVSQPVPLPSERNTHDEPSLTDGDGFMAAPSGLLTTESL